MDKLIDCKKFAEYQKEELKKLNIKPFMTVIKASDDEASEVYIRNKQRLCNELDFGSDLIRFDESATEEEIINKIKELNEDKSVHGIMLQLPLYKHLNKNNIINTINPIKDVDGLTTTNKGLLVNNTPILIPCTALGVVKLLEFYNIPIEGSNIVILGRSELVGLPLHSLLMNRNATVTLCHSKTKDITQYTNKADIIISAIGKPKYVTKDMIKESSVLIDVGITRVDDKLYGDFNFDDVYDKCKLITKVPGGIGLTTTIMLMYNLSVAYEAQRK